MPYWLQRFPQSSISNLVRQGPPLHPPKHHHLLHTDSSMKGLRAHTDNLKCRYRGHLRRHRTIAKPQLLVIHLVLNHWNLGAMVQKVSFRLNQTTPQHAVAYKQNGGTVYRNISPLTKTLFMSALEYNIIVHMRFIPGSMNAIWILCQGRTS